ncbi:MAG TPA: ABC transporter substrate binding protein [Methylomirabilota bacterium]|nr:ABC transporter substrate binding protein [Methylomirabilota bacterium]
MAATKRLSEPSRVPSNCARTAQGGGAQAPRDLPVEQAQEFEFFINMTTAKTLGVDIPHSLLLRADEIIQ